MRRPLGTACATSICNGTTGPLSAMRSSSVARTVAPIVSMDAAKDEPAESMSSSRSPAFKRNTRPILWASPPRTSTLSPTSLRPSTKNLRAAVSVALRSLRTKCVLHAIEEIPFIDRIAARTRIFFQQIALAFVHLGRHDNVHRRMMVAALRTANAGHAVAPQAQPRSGLCARSERNLDVAVERRNVDRRAERGLWEAHRNVHERIASIASKERMRPDAQVNV